MCELVKINECQFKESQKVEKIDQTKKTKNEEKSSAQITNVKNVH